MANIRVVTIGRQAGSGGREIGIQLAKELGFAYYDKELLKRAAQESGMCESLFESLDEKPKSLLYSLVMDPYSVNAMMASPYGSIEQNVTTAVFDAIKKVADEGPCVIVGRCADYALRDRDDCLHTFIWAPLEDRIRHAAERHAGPEDKVRELVRKTDKQRASYYNYYTNKRWGDLMSYDLCLSSRLLGIDGTVKLLRHIIED
ncbi:MAG: cytidylate kinase-like family protein [Clostridia bacterium]|nr:cytidylate kinase-like family protein [Clostridia bacterium]